MYLGLLIAWLVALTIASSMVAVALYRWLKG